MLINGTFCDFSDLIPPLENSYEAPQIQMFPGAIDRIDAHENME
jgi:hypothetical protein